jgi:hypothetical protein
MRVVERWPRAHALELFDADGHRFDTVIIGEVWDDVGCHRGPLGS